MKEAIAIFMAEAFKTNDATYIAHALGVVARAKGMSEIASRTGLSRTALSLVQRQRKSHAENHPGRHEGSEHQADR